MPKLYQISRVGGMFVVVVVGEGFVVVVAAVGVGDDMIL